MWFSVYGHRKEITDRASQVFMVFMIHEDPEITCEEEYGLWNL
jgi:hypothetical protein